MKDGVKDGVKDDIAVAVKRAKEALKQSKQAKVQEQDCYQLSLQNIDPVLASTNVEEAPSKQQKKRKRINQQAAELSVFNTPPLTLDMLNNQLPLMVSFFSTAQ